MSAQIIARHAPLAPGRYLRLRREAAGYSIEDLAALIAFTPEKIGMVHTVIERAEAGHAGSFAMLQLRLAQVVPLDRSIAWRLFELALDPEAELPVPDVCTGCGCSWHLPCDTADGPCGWRDGTTSRCTACPPEQA